MKPLPFLYPSHVLSNEFCFCPALQVLIYLSAETNVCKQRRQQWGVSTGHIAGLLWRIAVYAEAKIPCYPVPRTWL